MGDVQIMIKCSRCHCRKNILEFTKGENVLKTCNTCRDYTGRTEYMRHYRKANPEKKDTRDRREYMRKYNKTRKYRNNDINVSLTN